MKKIIKKLTPKFLLSLYHLILSYLGAFIYGFPSKDMIVIGVIGTRGKTTTANLIWACLTAAGHKTGLTGTANIRIGDHETLNKYHMTMPGRFVLQKLLSQMKRAGCKYAIIETPSEGVEQWRHKGIAYDMLVLTTLYPEYLEVHNWDYERCKKMHLKPFEELCRQPRKIIDGKKIPKVIIVNSDNSESPIFLEQRADNKVTYGLKSNSDFKPQNITATADGNSFFLASDKYQLRMEGGFNVLNALGAIAVASVLGIQKDAITQGLSNLKVIPGRMEKIEAGQKFKVFIDYAHDEISLKAVLKAAEELKVENSKIILLLGAEGGGRDKQKRPVMGDLAAKLTDYMVIANVDPYDDDPKVILQDIAGAAEQAGKIKNKDLFVIEDRREGIKKTLSLAKVNDIVLITGKGAEQAMIIKNRRISWDDRLVTRQELERLDKWPA